MKILQKKEKNYGIAVLRVILSFMVVLDHFYNKRTKKKFSYILYYHIPTFFLISFFYTHNYFQTFNIAKIKLRFERLVIPYFFWSLVAFIKNNIYYFLFKKECSHSIYLFLEHLLNGHIFVTALWFQNILVFTTLIISIVVFAIKKEYLLIFQILMLFSYKLQYSGDNYRFFKSNFTTHYKLTYGRFFESLPNSLTGFFIAAFNLPNKLKMHKFRTVIFSVIILIVLTKYYSMDHLLGFKYGGLRKNIAAVLIFFIFLFTFDKIRNQKIIKLLNIITNYTAGIYFIHLIIGNGYFFLFFLGNKIRTIFGCIILYSFSYITCFIIDKLTGDKIRLKHLIK